MWRWWVCRGDDGYWHQLKRWGHRFQGDRKGRPGNYTILYHDRVGFSLATRAAAVCQEVISVPRVSCL